MQAIMDSREREKTARRGAREDKEKEIEMGRQMRDAAMRGYVPAEELTDAAGLSNATVREKQGQRNKRKAPLQDSSAANQPPARRPRKSQEDSSLLDFFSEEKENSMQQIEALTERDDKRHSELVGAIHGLTNTIEKQQEFIKDVVLRALVTKN